MMKTFSELGVQPKSRRFVGKRIDMEEIIDQEIAVFDFRITKSKFPKKHSDEVTQLQIEIDNEKRVAWTTSKYLTEALEEIPKEGFPFKTTIIREGKARMFT